MSRGDIIDSSAIRSSRAAAARASPPASSGTSPQPRSASPNTSSATPTRASRGPSRTGSSSPTTPIWSSKGMTIGARAIGASLGLIYLRAEYALPAPHLEEVIHAAPRSGPAGPEHRRHRRFRLRHRGRPWARALTSAAKRRPSSNLWRASAASRATGRPSRWSRGSCTVPRWSTTSRRSPGWPASSPRASTGSRASGTAASAGRKLFSVSGDCARPGVYEFPFGITIAELLEEVGGENAKAVQVGGASGRCVPRAALQPAAILRRPPHRRLDHRDRPGSRHAGRRPQPARVLRRRVVRAVHSLPPGQQQAARRASRCSWRAPAPQSTWAI